MVELQRLLSPKICYLDLLGLHMRASGEASVNVDCVNGTLVCLATLFGTCTFGYVSCTCPTYETSSERACVDSAL